MDCTIHSRHAPKGARAFVGVAVESKNATVLGVNKTQDIFLRPCK